MRDIKITYNHIKNVRSRAENIVKDLVKRDLVDEQLEKEIMSAKSLDALDHLVKLIFHFNSNHTINHYFIFSFILSFSMPHLKQQINHLCLSVQRNTVWKKLRKIF